MFRVQGWNGGVAYQVTIDTTNTDEPVRGSFGVEGLLAEREGETATVTPTGPYLTLDLTNEASVLGALMAWTKVTQVTGEAPQVIPPDVAGAVY